MLSPEKFLMGRGAAIQPPVMLYRFTPLHIHFVK